MSWLLGAAGFALAGAFLYFRRVAAVGCAYKAKILCSAYFVTGRRLDPQSAPEISADAYKILRLFRARVDREKRRVTVSRLGFGRREAQFVPGWGGVLDVGSALPRPLPPPPGGVDPWPAPSDEPEAVKRLVDSCFSEENPRRRRRTRAVVVLQDGRLVAERYAPGFARETPLPGWSMTKAVIGALTGILIGRGRLSPSDRKLLAEWSGEGDPRAEISLEDLLRMRSGLAWSEKYADPFSDVNQMLWNRADAAAYAAAKPAARPPGTVWQYSSGTTNIVSLILRRALGEKDYAEFPRRALFEPLGMRSALIEPDASGTFVGSSFMFATARDWARFGQLYCQGGVWEGRRLLPEGWTQFCVRPTPQSDGRYGAHWWLKLQKELGGDTEDARRIPADAFYALGHEDQSVTVIPSRRLVAVRLGLSIYIDAWNHARFIAGLLDALSS